ncbi:hypothetical protein SKAU_G00378910 [Synaphobranchus kaupii]|uniref:Uncharacterized protein n=1 Tax=Synaphobranchus kaupii TaxID=118154 RepID=A0A9Q1ED89_SYNKA|nr:hypothetical protein SKAU_G00378910 [Synaphobranchus kaupii]
MAVVSAFSFACPACFPVPAHLYSPILHPVCHPALLLVAQLLLVPAPSSVLPLVIRQPRILTVTQLPCLPACLSSLLINSLLSEFFENRFDALCESAHFDFSGAFIGILEISIRCLRSGLWM